MRIYYKHVVLAATLATILTLGSSPSFSEESKSKQVEMPAESTEYAQAVAEVIEFAKKNDDPLAYLVAAKMSPKLAAPLSKGNLDGAVKAGQQLGGMNAPEAYTQKLLVSAAKSVAKDEAVRAFVEKTAASMPADSSSEAGGAKPPCWFFYCYGIFGCWTYCY